MADSFFASLFRLRTSMRAGLNPSLDAFFNALSFWICFRILRMSTRQLVMKNTIVYEIKLSIKGSGRSEPPKRSEVDSAKGKPQAPP